MGGLSLLSPNSQNMTEHDPNHSPFGAKRKATYAAKTTKAARKSGVPDGHVVHGPRHQREQPSNLYREPRFAPRVQAKDWRNQLKMVPTSTLLDPHNVEGPSQETQARPVRNRRGALARTPGELSHPAANGRWRGRWTGR